MEDAESDEREGERERERESYAGNAQGGIKYI